MIANEKTGRIYFSVYPLCLADQLVSQATLRGSTDFVNCWRCWFSAGDYLSAYEMAKLEVKPR